MSLDFYSLTVLLPMHAADSCVSTVAARLRTIGKADPSAILGETVAALLDVGEAHHAIFFRAVQGPAGPLVARWLHLGGSERARAVTARFYSAVPVETVRDVPSAAWDPGHLRAFELRGFVERSALFPDRVWQETRIYQDIFAPIGVSDQQRLLVADGRSLVGWIGLLRDGGAENFALRDRKRLAPLVAPIAARVVAAARLDAAASGEPGDLVVRPDGEVEFASANGKLWIEQEGFSDALRQRVRAIDRGLVDARSAVLDGGAETSVLRLDGREGVRYLVNVRRARPLRVSPLVELTEAERDVAEIAAAGATAREIAVERGTSEGTVRNQLKRIYRVLGVASRMELVNSLGEPRSLGTRT